MLRIVKSYKAKIRTKHGIEEAIIAEYACPFQDEDGSCHDPDDQDKPLPECDQEACLHAKLQINLRELEASAIAWILLVKSNTPIETER